MKEKSLIEFQSEEDALYHAESYDAEKSKIEKNDKNYTGLEMGNYRFLYPVLVNKYDSLSFGYLKGWMVQNLNNNKFKIILNLNASQMYAKYCSDTSYFGMGYMKSDFPYLRFDINHFKQEFLDEVNNYDEDLDYQIETKRSYLNEADKYLENIEKNLEYFESLEFEKYNSELIRIVNRFNFKEITDISKYKKCLYLVALDDYKQFYVGKSAGGLKNRMRKHWSAKVIPGRQTWKGGFDYSRMKFDNFKMHDATRIFVCDCIDDLIKNNKEMADDPRIECSNTFSFGDFYEIMDELAKAERIVINECKCMYCLSDRVPLMQSPEYDALSVKYGINKNELKIMHYNQFDKYKPLERTADLISMIERLGKRNK